MFAHNPGICITKHYYPMIIISHTHTIAAIVFGFKDYNIFKIYFPCVTFIGIEKEKVSWICETKFYVTGYI